VSEPLSSPLALFPWVAKRDGRLVPFDADKISRALFAAGESLGQSDAFLARELTDAVLHFLAAEADGSIPSTAQISETVVKVIRELGHPRLAQEFALYRRPTPATAESPPAPAAEDAFFAEIRRGVVADLSPAQLMRHLSRTCLRTYSLRAGFSRDLVAAHREGLLTLGNLEAPLELAGCVLPPPGPDRASTGGWVECIEEARDHVGDFLAFDGPDYALCEAEAEAGPFARALRTGLALTHLRAVVNLNAALPPAWAGDPAEGPLFAGQRRPLDRARLDAVADDLLDALPSLEGVRIDWHLSERDFAPEAAARLTRVARRAAEGAAVAFVFDRPRRPLSLGDGLDRQHSAVLLTVGLNLPTLVAHPRLRDDFLPKLGSLVRMALSAASQKREFLRRHGRGRPALTRGFFLQRARLVLAPVGLEAAVHRLHGQGLCDGGLDFARQVLQRLHDALRQDGAAHNLDACLDAPASFLLGERAESLTAEHVAGATAWDAAAPLRQQLRATGLLHAAAEAGTAALRLPTEQTLTTEEVGDVLRHAWQKTDVVRLRFLRVAAALRQLTLS
jgi:hypothetical protein